MLSLREKLANGILENQVSVVKIPKKFKSLGVITTDGYFDYDVPEDDSYLTKNTSRRDRLEKSTRARKHRKEIRRIRYGYEK